MLISTPRRVFAISPADPAGFQRTYQRLAEFGTLTPIPARSVFPTFLISRSWADRPARVLLLVSTLLSAALVVWCAWLAQAYPELPLRLAPDGSAVDVVPGVRILLLPVVNTFFYMVDLLLGLFFYRRTETQSLSYLMWGASSRDGGFLPGGGRVLTARSLMDPWTQLLIGFMLGVGVAGLAWRAGALTRSGALAAALLGGLIFGLGGLRWAALLLLFFITSSGLSHLFWQAESRPG